MLVVGNSAGTRDEIEKQITSLIPNLTPDKHILLHRLQKNFREDPAKPNQLEVDLEVDYTPLRALSTPIRQEGDHRVVGNCCFELGGERRTYAATLIINHHAGDTPWYTIDLKK